MVKKILNVLDICKIYISRISFPNIIPEYPSPRSQSVPGADGELTATRMMELALKARPKVRFHRHKKYIICKFTYKKFITI